jgi:tRNA-2-methylthio-N6-dimethylallyladenosine synthase
MVEHFVDAATCAERFERLSIVVERSALARHRARIGRVEDVLIEGPSKKDGAVTSGRTRQGKLVHFRTPEPLRPGSYAAVEVTEAAPHHLRGRLVEVTAMPAHRTRIPVVAG